MGQERAFDIGERALPAYIARPTDLAGPSPAILVIHEIFGPDAHIRDVADRFAREGFVAVAPNLFAGALEPLLTPSNIRRAIEALAEAPPDLRAHPEKMKEFAAAQPADRRPILEAFAHVTDPRTQLQYARELHALADQLRREPDVDPHRVASVGFCFGGAVSGLLATVDPKLRAAVIFYGRNPPLDQVPRIAARVLGLYGGEDPGITRQVPLLAEAMQVAGKPFESHTYPGAKHAFFNDARPNYHAESARDAWPRVLEFLRRSMPPPSGSA